MLKRRNRILIDQLDSKMTVFQKAAATPAPSGGWIYAIRTSLNMSLRQLAARLKMTPQGVKLMEDREKEGAITIKSLKEVAKALDMELVYGFVPVKGSVEAMINDRANELARQIVLRTSMSMTLEDQKNSIERIEKAIEERAEELKNENLRLLWD